MIRSRGRPRRRRSLSAARDAILAIFGGLYREKLYYGILFDARYLSKHVCLPDDMFDIFRIGNCAGRAQIS
jgi:hypothetical protein